jgi:hypothetical protein
MPGGRCVRPADIKGDNNMCQFASFVLTKDRVFYSDKSDSHESIIRENGLHVDGTHGPNILRVELTPPTNGDLADFSKWQYRIDQDITPDWAPRCDTAAMAETESRVRAALDQRFAKGIIIPENLYLNGCTGLKALPDNLKVGGYLSLDGCTGLKALPDNLKVVGSLYLPQHLRK